MLSKTKGMPLYKTFSGILLFTVLYFLFAFIFQYFINIDCLHEPCNSEGIDNTTIGWATDFYISICMFAMGYHLLSDSNRNKSIAMPAAVAQISAGLGYFIGGITHIFFPNNGTGDGYGMVEFYVLWAIGYALLTASCVCLYLFASRVSQNKNLRHKITQGVTVATVVGIILACLLILIGCFRCLFSSDIIFTTSIMDDMPNIGHSPTCTDYIFYGEGLWMTLYSTFAIPWGILLFKFSRNDRGYKEVQDQAWWLGLKPSLAAILCPIILWTIGYMYIGWVQTVVVLTNHPDIALLYRDMHGAVIHHLGVALFFFLSYNIAWKFSDSSAS